MFYTLYLWFLLVTCVLGCPKNWIRNKQNCYLFVSSPITNWTAAHQVCNALGSNLLSVNDIAEHKFISEYLYTHDPALKNWLTSGIKIRDQSWIWTSDHLPLSFDSGWNSEKDAYDKKSEMASHFIIKRDILNDLNFNNMSFGSHNNLNFMDNRWKNILDDYATELLIYKYSFKDGSYRWNTTKLRDQTNQQSFKASFICETNFDAQILVNANLNSFISLYSTENFYQNSEMGPIIDIQPSDTTWEIKPPHDTLLIESIDRRVQLRCHAKANPNPIYTWFKNDVPIITTAREPISFLEELQGHHKSMHGQSSQASSYLFGVGQASNYENSQGHLGQHVWNPALTQNINNFDEKGYDRLSLTNGILDIFDPSTIDQGVYHCAATNKFGTSISSKARLSFGYIKDFKPEALPIKGFVRSNAIIPCQAPEAYPDVNFFWFKEQLPNFVPSDARIFHSWKGNLYFSTLDMSDDGNYICMIKSSVSKASTKTIGKTSKNIRLTVSNTFLNSRRKPVIEIGFPAIFPSNPLIGQEVRIECVAYADPIPRYNWTRAGNLALPPQARLTDFNRVLIIPAVSSTDNGNYLCKASNQIGETEQSVYLSVSAAPIFTRPLQDQTVSPGSTIVLYCEAYGNPEVKYRWFKNGQLFSGDNSGQNLNNAYENPSPFDSHLSQRIRFLPDEEERDKAIRHGYGYVTQFKIVEIHNAMEKDSGMYQCEASNGHGTHYSTAQVSVIATKPMRIHKRALNVEDNDYNPYDLSIAPKIIARGSSINLSCDMLIGSPTPEYTWYLTRFEEHMPTTGNRRKDRKEYQRLMLNPYRFFMSYAMSLAIDPSTILTTPQKTVKITADNRKYYNDHNINNNNYDNEQKYVSNRLLQIRKAEIEDSGIYTCLAQNEKGSTYFSYRIIVARSTSIVRHPLSLSVRPESLKPRSKKLFETHKNITLECQASVEPGIEISFIWLHNGIDIDTQQNFMSGSQKEQQKTWLKNDYRPLRFVKTKPRGKDDVSQLILVNVDSDHSGVYICIAKTAYDEVHSVPAEVLVPGPPSAPSTVSVSDISTNSATLKWVNGGDNGSPITEYVIQARTKYRDWYTLSKVIATSVKIIGGPNVEFHRGTSGTRYAQRIHKFTSSNNYNLYNRHYFQNDRKHEKTHSMGHLESSLLLPYNTYEFRIAARNEMGWGPFSASSSSYTTEADKPRVIPRGLRGGGGLTGDLVIKWDPLLPDEHGGPGLGYEVSWIKKTDWERSRGQGKWERILVRQGETSYTQSSYTARVGAENYYTEYMVKIRAINIEGNGPESGAVTIWSAEDVPTKEPTLVQAFPFNSTGITVRWRSISPNIADRDVIRGKLLGYKIQYGLLQENIGVNDYSILSTGKIEDISSYIGNDRRTRIVYGAPREEGIVIGLMPNSKYWLKVMAFNSAGNGPLSDPVFMNTFKEAPLMQPMDVYARGPNYEGAIRITWSGIHTSHMEEPLEGYKVRIWEGREDISEPIDIPIGLIEYYELFHLPEHKIYKIRVLGYSRGGDGKMSEALEICLKCNEEQKQNYIERMSQEYLKKLELQASLLRRSNGAPQALFNNKILIVIIFVISGIILIIL